MGKDDMEAVKCLYDQQGVLIAFFRNDIKNRSVKLYTCKEASLDDIDEIFQKAGLRVESIYEKKE